MIVPNDPKVFDQLKNEVLDSCPADSTPSFKESYEYYVRTFFGELTIHANIFFDLTNGTCTLDLDFLKVDSKQIALQYMSEHHSLTQPEFLMGINFAETVTMEVLIFALAMKPESQVA